MNNITLTTKTGDKITTASSEGALEQDNVVKILKEPRIYDYGGFDETRLTAGMNKEIESVKKYQVFTEINVNDNPLDDRKNVIQSRWGHREKEGTEVRSRIVANGYKEAVADLDDVYMHPHRVCILRTLLTLAALTLRLTISAGDVSTAFFKQRLED